MESIATELINLLRLAGLPVNEQRKAGRDASISEVRLLVPDAIRDVRYRRAGQGTIAVTIPGDKCFVAVEISAFNVDISQTNTVQIGILASPGVVQELQCATNGRCLYVFGPKAQAQFVFVFTEQPWAATVGAFVEVRGYFLPSSALARLKGVSTVIPS